METAYIVEKAFDKIDFANKTLEKADYEACYFNNCNFLNADLSNIRFTDCEFTGCDLSTAKMVKTAFQNIKFKDCKLLGLHFDHCSDFLFEVDFENCILGLSSFYQRKLKKTRFKNCGLQEVDFAEADLSQAVFDNCDLAKAVFENTVLEKADFRTSFNYSINPEMNKIKKARFSMPGVIGLLDKYDIEVDYKIS
jgi:fluoroquinolone resistance protein